MAPKSFLSLYTTSCVRRGRAFCFTTMVGSSSRSGSAATGGVAGLAWGVAACGEYFGRPELMFWLTAADGATAAVLFSEIFGIGASSAAKELATAAVRTKPRRDIEGFIGKRKLNYGAAASEKSRRVRLAAGRRTRADSLGEPVVEIVKAFGLEWRHQFREAVELAVALDRLAAF